MQQLSHWAGRYQDVTTNQIYQLELREDEFEDIVVLELSGHDTDPDDDWKSSGKVIDRFSAAYVLKLHHTISLEPSVPSRILDDRSRFMFLANLPRSCSSTRVARCTIAFERCYGT